MTRPGTRKITLALLVATLGLSACSGWRSSAVNPSNWFGRSRPAEVSPADLAGAEANPLLPDEAEGFVGAATNAVEGVAIAQVSSLVVEATIEGAIIRAEGIATRQGAFDARLIPDFVDEAAVDGVLSYRFVVKYPKDPTAQGSTTARTISVARSVTAQHLEGVRVIRVSGAENAREVRRR